jgi:hypothetical protein
MELLSTFVTAPGRGFDELRKQPRFLFPLLLTLLCLSVTLIWYYSSVDFVWLREQVLSASMRNLSAAERTRAEGLLSRNTIMWTAVIGGLIGIIVQRTIESTYYYLAGQVTSVRHSFGDWFAFSCWTALPLVLGVVPAMTLLALNNSHQLATPQLQALSLNELFFHRGPQEKGFSLLSSLTVLHFLAWGLALIGVRVWSGRSWAFSAGFTLLFPLVYYGGWAVLAFAL